jgi:hypothetical protein
MITKTLLLATALVAFAAPAMAAPPVPVDVLPTTMITLYHEGLPPEAIGSTYDLGATSRRLKRIVARIAALMASPTAG